MKRRKPKELRKEDSIRIRVTAEQKRLLEKTAARAGLGVSSWMLTTCLSAAMFGVGGTRPVRAGRG